MGIPKALIHAIANDDVVLFVGAGLSIGAGLPGWDGLLQPLADEIALPDLLCSDPLQVAQYYESERGRWELINYIVKQTDSTAIKPTENHLRLTQLGIHTWVTTNYDDLLEKTLDGAKQPYRKIVKDQNIPFITTKSVTLIKLHGDREQPDTIVVTRRDYDTYHQRFPLIKEKLKALLAEKTFLFVGYGVRDPDFTQIQNEIATDLQQLQRQSYAVLFDADRFAQSRLRANKIEVLNIVTNGQVEYSSRLAVFLADLINQVNQVRLPTIEPLASTTQSANYSADSEKTILIVAANPTDMPPLRLDREIHDINDGLRRAKRGNRFRVVQTLAATPLDFRRAMLDHRPEIVHFIGHGAAEKGIAFVDTVGKAQLVTSESLAKLFELFSNTKCVVLNACYTENQAKAIAQYVKYVIGMSHVISDTAAREFAIAFYDALGASESIEFAYRFACNAIQMEELAEELIPILITGNILLPERNGSQN